MGTASLFVLEDNVRRDDHLIRIRGESSDRLSVSLVHAAVRPSSSRNKDVNDDDDDDEDCYDDDDDDDNANEMDIDPDLGVPVWRDKKTPAAAGTTKAGKECSALLVKENRVLNATETEEGFVVQFLVAGGWKSLLSLPSLQQQQQHSRPRRAASSIHAGMGQQVLGWGPHQRVDLTLFFDKDAEEANTPAIVAYVNHHGQPWHYDGHQSGCIRHDGYGDVKWKPLTRRMDAFREGLCEAFSKVAPADCLFEYKVTTSCSHVHGRKKGRALVCAFDSNTTHRNVRECLQEAKLKLGKAERETVWLPPQRTRLTTVDVVRGVIDGTLTGFVSLSGGLERGLLRQQRDDDDDDDDDRDVHSDPAGARFGFCVQNYAPKVGDLSPRTQREIAAHFGWPDPVLHPDGRRKLQSYLDGQPPRTLNAASFLSEETVSTTYLRWLILERQFTDFKVTHFLHYEFRDWGSDYLLPILQRRHEEKQKGRLGSAECLKLLGNGSYGYNGLESCNYDDMRLVTSDNLNRKVTKDLRHLNVKHITQLGIVRVLTRARSSEERRQKRKTQPKKARGKKARLAGAHFLSSEAACSETDDDDDDDGDGDDETNHDPTLGGFINDDDDDDDEDDANNTRPSLCRQQQQQQQQQRTPSTALTSLEAEKATSGFKSAHALYASAIDSTLKSSRHHRDHTYSRSEPSVGLPVSPATESPEKRERLTFLWSLVTDGSKKRIFNTLPRAAAVLSNSKRLFLGHVSTMFRCLDPALTELCYIDTDSCVWSQTHKDLELCVRPDRQREWKEASIMADESLPTSCHGKLKQEGLFDSGVFKTMKIYRLFTNADREKRKARDSEDDDDDDDDERGGECSWKVAYTRCKGIARWAADQLPSSQFDPLSPPSGEEARVAVGRNCLRPSRAGEIRLFHETRSLALPFNMKRWVTQDGIHTLAFGLPSHYYPGGDADGPPEDRI